MKIVFVGSLYAPNGVGGAERTVQTIAEMAVRLGHEVATISLAPNGKASSADIHGVRAHYVPLANIHFPFGSRAVFKAWRRALWHAIDAYNPWMAARVGRILDQEKPDVVQTGNLMGFSAAVWKAAQRRGIPVVQMLHDYYMGCANSSMFKNGHNCQRQCGACRVFTGPRRAMSDTPSAVISLSARLLERVTATGMFPNVQHRVVIHGASDLRPVLADAAPLAAGAGLTVGYLGRLEPTKGLEFMLDGVAQVPQVRVLLAGKGDDAYVRSLQARYQGAGNIEFLGFTKPADLFARIDLLLVPSMWEEPLGRVIYEAYAHGIPSIVTRGGGMPEIVEPGRTGFVVEPGDTVGLAALVRRLAAGWDRPAFRAACLDKSEEFQVDKLISSYLEVWNHAIASRPGR
jgi:glycosyltransferase involved in cell wall biosynthesis